EKQDLKEQLLVFCTNSTKQMFARSGYSNYLSEFLPGGDIDGAIKQAIQNSSFEEAATGLFKKLKDKVPEVDLDLLKRSLYDASDSLSQHLASAIKKPVDFVAKILVELKQDHLHHADVVSVPPQLVTGLTQF